MKVNEYIHSESRDLWEYSLDLQKDDIKKLLDHLWELLWMSEFDYYFLDENCSYHLWNWLAVGKESWPPPGSIPFYVAPHEMVTFFHSNSYGAKKQTSLAPSSTPSSSLSLRPSSEPPSYHPPDYRPSLRQQMITAWEHLETSEQHLLLQTLKFLDTEKNEADPLFLQHPRRYQLLWTLSKIYQFYKHEEDKSFHDHRQKIYHNVLKLLSQEQEPEDWKKRQQEQEQKERTYQQQWKRPDQSPPGSRVSLFIQDSSRVGLAWRGGHRDFLDSTYALDTFQKMVFLEGAVSMTKHGQAEWSEFVMADLVSLYPYHPLDKRPSWSLKASLKTLMGKEMKHHQGVMMFGHFGSAWELKRDRALVYLLTGPTLEVAPSLWTYKARPSWGLNVGFIWKQKILGFEGLWSGYGVPKWKNLSQRASPYSSAFLWYQIQGKIVWLREKTHQVIPYALWEKTNRESRWRLGWQWAY
jgi:hypothetical protein